MRLSLFMVCNKSYSPYIGLIQPLSHVHFSTGKIIIFFLNLKTFEGCFFLPHPFEKVQLEMRRAAQKTVPRMAQLHLGEFFALVYLEVFIDFTFLCKNTDLIYDVTEEAWRIILPIRPQNCPTNCPGKREKIC